MIRLIFSIFYTIMLLVYMYSAPTEWSWLARILTCGFLLLDVAIWQTVDNTNPNA